MSYYHDDSTTLHHGDSLAVLRTLPDASVDCCVTSPPYFGLRDYGAGGQYGLEASPPSTSRRCAPCSPRCAACSPTTGRSGSTSATPTQRQAAQWTRRTKAAERRQVAAASNRRLTSGCRQEPARHPVAHRFRAPGRRLDSPQRHHLGQAERHARVRHRPPLSTRHEHLFMFSKSRALLVRPRPHPRGTSRPRAQRAQRAERRCYGPAQRRTAHATRTASATRTCTASTPTRQRGGRNPGDVWTVATQPFSEAHFAVMPQALAERAILAGCKPGGTVLDPFSGSGTTGLAAAKHGRKYVGIDLSSDYLDLSLRTGSRSPGSTSGRCRHDDHRPRPDRGPPRPLPTPCHPGRPSRRQ